MTPLRRILISLAMVLLVATPGQAAAQASAGVRVGGVLSNVSGPLFGAEGRRALTAAVFGRMPVGIRWALQAELGWVPKGTRAESGQSSVELNTAYLQLPIMLQYVLREEDWIARFYGGAAINWLRSCGLEVLIPDASVGVDCGLVQSSDLTMTAQDQDIAGLFGLSTENVRGRLTWLFDVRMEVGGGEALTVRSGSEPTEGARHFHIAASLGVAIPIGGL